MKSSAAEIFDSGEISLADDQPEAKRRGRRALALMLAIYLVTFIYYYPPIYGIEDEVGFINQAVLWSQGAISAEGAAIKNSREFNDLLLFKGRHVVWRNPGRSLLLLPFLKFFGFGSIFLTGALIHIALVIAAAAILERLSLSAAWAVLVLCHPTLALYSRTILADEAGGLFLTLAVLLMLSGLKRRAIWAGVLIGAAALMRYQTAIVLPFFALALWVIKRRRESLECLAAGSGIGALIICYNLYLFGNISGNVGQGFFSLAFIPRNLLFYVSALCVVYPLMLLAPLFDTSFIRPLVCAIGMSLLALLLPYYFYDRGVSTAQTLVLGLRLLAPALPIWIVSYAFVCDKFLLAHLKKVLPVGYRAITVIVCAALLFSVIVIFRLHQAHLKSLASARREIIEKVPPGSLVIANSTVIKLFSTLDPSLPSYRFERYDFEGNPVDQTSVIKAEKKIWYLVLLSKDGSVYLPNLLQRYMDAYHLIAVPTRAQGMVIYSSPATMLTSSEE
jgi:hypothetical protein